MIKNILITLICLSAFGIADMIYRYRKGTAYRKLKKAHKPTRFTLYILDEYEHFFKPCWWHWVLLVIFFTSIGLFLSDTN